MIQADGGTRTASITSAYVAVAQNDRRQNCVATCIEDPGCSGEAMLDLCYEEDSRAEVDFNVVMTGEGEPFARESMDRLMNLAQGGISELMKIQRTTLNQ